MCVSYEILQTGRHFEYHKPNPTLGCRFFCFVFQTVLYTELYIESIISEAVHIQRTDMKLLLLFMIVPTAKVVFLNLCCVESCQSVCVHH